MKKGRQQQTPRKSRESSGTILKTYIGKYRRNGKISRYI
jgi:hypothetical protein